MEDDDLETKPKWSKGTLGYQWTKVREALSKVGREFLNELRRLRKVKREKSP